MSSHVKYVDVIIPVPVYKLFTYSIPDEYKEKIKPGIRVTVQFGAKKIYAALAYKIHNKKPIEYDTKEVISVIDTEPVVNQRQLEFWEWIFL